MKKSHKNSSKKVTLLFSVALIMILLGIVGLNYAYASLTAKDQKMNEFQLGEVKGNVTEKFTPPSPDTPVKPGDTYSKEVTITNDSTLPFFVRVLITPEIQSAEGVLLASNIGSDLTIDLGSDWLVGEDGYYYYLKEVLPNTATSNLFTKVSLASNLSSDYDQATMAISIKSETVTSVGENYRTAWWQGDIPKDTNLTKIDTTLQAINAKGGG